MISLKVFQVCFQTLNHSRLQVQTIRIPVKLLKEIPFQIAPSLAIVFQSLVNQCKLSADWKVTHVISLFKKGGKSSPCK